MTIIYPSKPPIEALALVKTKKPAAGSLGMAKHPLPTEMFLLFGRKLIFAYPMSHLCLLGFTFMFLNVNTLYRFNVFCSLMTGNILDCVLDLKAKEYKVVLFKSIVILTHAIGGTFMSCYLLEYYNNRENVFAIIMVGLVMSCVLVDFLYLDNNTDNHYVVLWLCLICGALAHWSSKLGYVVMLHTGNLFKLSESLFLFVNGYSVGGAKLRGDVIILFFVIVASLFGALFASVSLIYVPRASLMPVLATIPLHLHLSGCFQVWGFPMPSFTNFLLTRGTPKGSAGTGTMGTDSAPNGRSSRAGITNQTTITGTTGTTTGLGRDSGASAFNDHDHDDDYDTRSTGGGGELGPGPRGTGSARPTLAARGRAAMLTLFERVEITPEELLEFQQILGSYNHKVQENNNM